MAYEKKENIVSCCLSNSYTGGQTGYMSWHIFTGTEASAQIRFGKCVLKAIYLYIFANTAGATVTLYKNGIVTSTSFVIGATSTGQIGTTCSVSLADGDRLSLQIAIDGNASKSITFAGGGYYTE